MAITAQALFDYANRFARKSEASDRGTQYPTVRQAAKRFKVSVDDIEEACNDYCADGYLGIAVGFRTGAGIGSYNSKGACLVEAYN